LLDDPLFITLAISSTLTISYLTIPIGSWHIHPPQATILLLDTSE
jgi:hypothetical protein